MAFANDGAIKYQTPWKYIQIIHHGHVHIAT